jgi:hypothetical protein
MKLILFNILITLILCCGYTYNTTTTECTKVCSKHYNNGGISYYYNDVKLGCLCTTVCCAIGENHCDIHCLQKVDAPIIYNYRCGQNYYNKNCTGLWSDYCCSRKGFCGLSQKFCGYGCQKGYGRCGRYKAPCISVFCP